MYTGTVYNIQFKVHVNLYFIVTTVNDRFIASCEYLISKGIASSYRDILLKAKLGTSVITEVKKGRSNVGSSTLQKLKAAYPILNLGWINERRGDMITVSARNILDVVEALGKTFKAVGIDMKWPVDEAVRVLTFGDFTSRFLEDFSKTYGVNERWLRDGFGTIILDTPEGRTTLDPLRDFKSRKSENLSVAISILLSKEQEVADRNEGDELYNLISDVEYLDLQRQALEREISSLAPLEVHITDAGRETMQPDSMPLAAHGPHSKLLNISKDVQALLVPLVHKYNYKRYPRELNDDGYISGLSQYIFTIHKAVPTSVVRAFEMIDTSMEDGSVDSICDGDIVVGVSRSVSDPLFDSPVGTFDNVNFVIVTKDNVFCRSLLRVHRAEGYIEYFAKNPDKETYPDLKIQIADIQELYWVRRIERSKL